METSKLEIKPYSIKEMANIYHVGIRTFKTWLKSFSSEIGSKRGWYYTTNQVLLIIEKLGLP